MEQFDIAYLDTLEGGAGSTRLYLTDVPYWLAKNKGYLIREMQPVSTLAHADAHREATNYGWEQLASKASRR